VDLADESMHPGSSSPGSNSYATLVLFCDPSTHGGAVANLILAPGDLVRLHRVRRVARASGERA